MMFRSALAVTLFLVALPLQGYTVVLRSGKTVRATGPIRYEGAKAIVPLVGGGIGFLPAKQVDRCATEARNEGQPGYAWKYREVPRPPEREPEPMPPPHPPLGLFYPGGLTKNCYDDQDLPGKRKPLDEERQVEAEPSQLLTPKAGAATDSVGDQGWKVTWSTTGPQQRPAAPYGLIPIDPSANHARAAAKVEAAREGQGPSR